MTKTLAIDTPMPPPHWALLERELLKAQADGCRAFFDHYFDARGYLLCVPRWGGDDGPDDAAENLLNWTMLHALGGADDILDLYKLGWEGHLQQYTEARTVEVPMARDGMYYKEFPVMFDWFHNGEGYSAFFLQGLSDPDDRQFQVRSRRFAGFYMDEDPQAKNYDPERKLIRSMFNGSRGPLLRKATGLDWAGDPIEIEGRFRLGHGERSYDEMVAHFKDYNDVVGDHPINLASTILQLNAYMLAHEEKYRQWLIDYVDVWVERTRENGGIIPTNVGLDGVVGSECGGRWYGGVYGWGFTVTVPQTGELAHRTYFHTRALHGFGNAVLLTGDQRYVDTWRGVIDFVNSNAREIDGQLMYPNAYGDYFGEEDWYDFHPEPFTSGALEVYYWSNECRTSGSGGGRSVGSVPGGTQPGLSAGGVAGRPCQGAQQYGEGAGRHSVAGHSPLRRHESHQSGGDGDAYAADAGRAADRSHGRPAPLPAALLRPGSATGRHPRRCGRAGGESERRFGDGGAGQHQPGRRAQGHGAGRGLRRTSVRRGKSGRPVGRRPRRRL